MNEIKVVNNAYVNIAQVHLLRWVNMCMCFLHHITEVYEELQKEYPRAHFPRRRVLDLANGIY